MVSALVLVSSDWHDIQFFSSFAFFAFIWVKFEAKLWLRLSKKNFSVAGMEAEAKEKVPPPPPDIHAE